MSEFDEIGQQTYRSDYYTPLDWYWISEAGRIYASARAKMVAGDDKELAAFKETGRFPTPWPKDAEGQESDAELDNVLRPYGLSLAGRLQVHLSFREFIRLFTPEEQLKIVQAAMTDASTKLWYDQAVGAQYIDLSDPDLADGLGALVSAKLLTATRRSRVLKGLPPA